MARQTRSHRLRTVLFAALMGVSTFAVEAAPTAIPLPRPAALTPQPAEALGCASDPTFTGRVTSSSTSSSAITRTTTGNVFGYLSNVVDNWSCTAFYRYDGLAWARNATGTLGNFDWGNLINSTSVACNWVIGSTDFLKGNSTTDCPDSDAEYALPVHFDDTSSANLLQAVAHADNTPDQSGDFAFIHSDCTSYYNGEVVQNNVDFASGTVGNRPGANCDPTLLDSTNTTQSIVIDNVKPVLSFTAPAGVAGTVTGFNTAGNPYGVKFTATDATAGFDATHTWKLQRLIGSAAAGVCSGMVNDTAAGSVVTGTLQTLQTNNQTLTVPACYRWQLSATDANGNVATMLTSADVITDVTAPTAAFTSPAGGATVSRNVTAFSVTWTDGDTGSGIASRSLQRQRVAATSSACPGTFANDGSAVTTASPSSQTLTSGFCYQWIQTISDRAGLQIVVTSGKVYVDTTIPMADFSTPNEGSTTIQSSTTYTTSWTETAGTGTITARSTQRQKATVITPGSCADVTWADNGTPWTAGSAIVTSGLNSDRCWRWVTTLTNSAGKIGVTTSGSVLVDASVPTGTITYPETNRALAGDVVVTGTATDVGSFKEYQLEYGAGLSPASWTSIGLWTTPVSATGPLGTWATGSLNGVYTLRLTVRDQPGNTASVTDRVVYVENAKRGDASYFTRQPFDLGGGYTLDVGVANGEARLSRDLFSFPSFGPAQALSLTYSSLEPGTAGKFGVGWSSNLTQYLTFESGFTVWHRADGGRVPFGSIASVWKPLRGHFETMTVGGGEVSITTKDQTTYVFEDTGAGRLKRVTNRFGKSLTMAWSATSATATDATTPTGRVTTLAIDSTNNRITSVTDSAGRVWGFGYTGLTTNSDLTTITDPAAKDTAFVYAAHALTTITRQRSRNVGAVEPIAWTIAYTSGKATTVTDPEDAATGSPRRNKLTYVAGLTTVEILKEYSPATAAWNTTTYAVDSLGRVTSDEIVDAVNSIDYTTSRTYDADSNLLTLDTPVDTGATTARTTYTYDAVGNVLTEIVPIDGATSVKTVNAYNATNDLLTRTDADLDTALRMVTLYTYLSGHLTAVNVNCTTTGTAPPTTGSSCTGLGTQDASTNLITNFAYTANDQLAYEQDPLGHVTKHVYDTWGNETSTYRNCTTTGTGAPSPFDTCTAGGTIDAQTNVRTQATFDQATVAGKAGLPTKTTDPLGRDTTYTYYTVGRLWTETLPGDASIPALTKTTTWDELGNTLTETEGWTPIGGGSVVSRQTLHAYDLVNGERTTTDPAGLISTTAHDAARDVVSTTSAGVTSTAAFDALGRVTSEAAALGTTNHGYDAQGNETQTDTPAGATARTYTQTGWVIDEITDPTTLVLTIHHTYDTLGRELTTIDPEGTTTTLTYDRAGRQLSTATGGATSTTAYDRNGNTLSVKNPDGDVTATIVDPLDRARKSIVNCTNSGTTQPGPGVVCTGTGTPDAATNLTTTSNYDAGGATIAITDPKGVSNRTITNVRDLSQESIAACTDDGTSPPSTANPPTCTADPTPPLGTNIRTTTIYDGQGATVSSVVAVGTGAAATSYTAYDAAGRVQASLDPMGTITRSFYDTTTGQQTKTVVNCTTSGTIIPSPWAGCTGAGTQDGTFNLTTTYTYDANGNQATVTAPNGRITSSIYDDADRLLRLIDNYVDGNPSSSATDDLTTTYYYDEASRQTAISRPTSDGLTLTLTRYLYDDNGRLLQQIDHCVDTPTVPPTPIEECTATGTKDAQTNLIATYAYDARGNRIRMIAPDPSETSATPITPAYVTTQYAYDVADRLCRVVESATLTTDLQSLTHPCTDATQGVGTATLNVSTQYTYDDAGNMVSMIDGAGHTTTYAYDAAGQLTGQSDALGKTVAWAYDALGNRIRQDSRVDFPAIGSITWTYDGAGRQLTRTADGVTTTTVYDANGNRRTTTTGSQVITAFYDGLNRVLTVDDEDAGTTADTTYTYSLTSPSWTDPTGTYAVSLNKFDRATVLNDPVDATDFTTAYRADGQAASIAAPNGNTTAYIYDPAGHLTSKNTTAAGPVNRALYAWSYNRAGRILSEASTITGDASNGTLTYGYDPLGRLTGSTVAGTTTGYGWDTVPNRTSVQVGAGTPITTAYDAANRPTSGTNPTVTYTSDADGRLTAQPGQQLVWDHLGRLTQVKNSSGTVLATYSYDPLDRLRLVDYGGSNRIRFRYVGMTTSAAQWIDDVAGTVTRSIGTGWSGERLVDWTGSGTNIRIYGENAHHDVTWLADSTGSVSQALRYDPWGTPRVAVPTGYAPFRFQGSWFDDTTALSWVVSRWFSPGLGRFVSEDSMLGDAIDPPSRHLYAYGQGEPVGRWDPDGRLAFSTLAYRTFPNRGHVDGRLELGLFIEADHVWVPPIFRTVGDNRGFSSGRVNCKAARGCLIVDFGRKLVTMRVNPTCNDHGVGVGPLQIFVGLGCNDAFQIVPFGTCGRGWDDRCNLLSVHESWTGVIEIRWDITQSRLPIIRPDATVNGYMVVNPGTKTRTPKIDYYGDGFPSEELYYFRGSQPRYTLFQHHGIHYWDMAEWLGDWSSHRSLPRDD